MKTYLTALMLGAVIVGGAWWAYSRSSHIVAAEHERFERALEHILRLDSSFNQDVLRVRFRLLEDYDSLGAQIADIERSLADLSPMPAFVGAATGAALEPKIAQLSALLNEKADLVESFKSDNAVLKNSLRYFPLGATELIKRLGASGRQPALRRLVDDLMGEVLTYSVAPGVEQEQRIRATLAQIEAWRAQHPRDAEAAVVASLNTHVGTILKRRPKVDAQVQQLVSPATAHLAGEAAQLYTERFSRAVQSAQRYRTVLYGLCTVLVAGIAYALHALRRANVHLERRRLDLAQKNDELQRARDNLEKAVAERTGELDQANRALHAANEKLSSFALYDGLTGLPNRRLLDERMAQAVSSAAQSGKSFALMFVDLDRFKPVNDTFGHRVGDELLKSVAQRLTGCVRTSDTVARTGGDEFVVVLGEIADPNDAALVAGKILDELQRPFSPAGHHVSISGSIGISVYPQDAQDVTDLKTHADDAMYCAKRNGRSTYRFFAPEMGVPGRKVAAGRSRPQAA